MLFIIIIDNMCKHVIANWYHVNVLTYNPEVNTEQASKAQLTNKTQLGEALYFRRTYL